MSDALSGMIPLAIAIAVSPIPILAVILMLLTERSTANAIGGVVALLGIGRADSAEDPSTGLLIAQFVLAALLLAGAARRWRMRARPGDDHETPKWMNAVRSVHPPRAFALGIGLIALNPKDALLTIATGARLAESDAAGASAVIALVVFALVSSTTIVAPILAEAAMGARAEPILERSRAWLERNGNAAVAIVLAVLGALVAIDAARYL
jgi:threonine/homoserine/homoserine lactone efflux protein